MTYWSPVTIMKNIFDAIAAAAAILMVVLILLQNRGQSLGAAWGGDSGFYRSKRGAEKFIFNGTIVLAVIFVMAVVLGVLAKR